MGVQARLLGWRDRTLSDPRFLRFSSRFALTRPVARRETAALFDLCAGFIYAQTLAACVDLDIFETVAAAPRRLDELARLTGLPPAGALALAEAAVGLRLLSRRDGTYALGMLGAALRGDPGIAAMVRHHAMLYADLRDPVGVLRGGAPTRLGTYWAYAGGAPAPQPEQVRGYTALMAASQPMIAESVLDAYDFSRHRCLLDVGGGNGAFLAAVAARAPRPPLILFDLPAVIDAARENLARLDLTARVTCLAGDFRTEPLPTGADVISLVRVLHDHDDEQVTRLLARAHAALPPGGTLVVAEPMADSPRASAYFSIYLRAMGSGRPRRSACLREMLRGAGFGGVKVRRTAAPLLVRVLVGRKGKARGAAP